MISKGVPRLPRGGVLVYWSLEVKKNYVSRPEDNEIRCDGADSYVGFGAEVPKLAMTSE
jgi:hypothetical protein